MLNSRSARFLSEKNRWFVLKFAVVAVFALVTARLFDLQIIQHDYYMREASAQHMLQKKLPARRGEIYFRDGPDRREPAVMNERVWTVFVDPSYVLERDKVQIELTRILGDRLTVDWDKVWADLTNMYVEVAKNVDFDTATAVKAADLRGVGLKEGSKRVYPSGDLAAQVLGFMNAEGVGIGVEGSENKALAGKDGLLKTVADVNMIPLNIGENNVEISAENGQNLVLTIDANIQREAERLLRWKVAPDKTLQRGSVLVLDPNNGEVLAMANYPTFSPEKYWEVKDSAVFRNIATELPYEPASVCKPFTFAAALNEGRIRPEDTYLNVGWTKVNDRVIHNVIRSSEVTGEITFQMALNRSLNTGSVEALRRIGGGEITYEARKKLFHYLLDFGLGQKTLVGVREEGGSLISPDDEQGNAVRYSNMTFGQGMSATMLQVGAAYATLVNGGKYYQPTLIAGTVDGEGRFTARPALPAVREVIDADTSRVIRKMLVEVRATNMRWGYPDKAGYNIGAKTGTAETYDEEGNYTPDKTNAGIAGFGGAKGDNALPAYVIVIRMDGDRLVWGANEATMMFTELSNYLLEYLRIEPEGEDV